MVGPGAGRLSRPRAVERLHDLPGIPGPLRGVEAHDVRRQLAQARRSRQSRLGLRLRRRGERRARHGHPGLLATLPALPRRPRCQHRQRHRHVVVVVASGRGDGSAPLRHGGARAGPVLRGRPGRLLHTAGCGPLDRHAAVGVRRDAVARHDHRAVDYAHRTATDHRAGRLVSRRGRLRPVESARPQHVRARHARGLHRTRRHVLPRPGRRARVVRLLALRRRDAHLRQRPAHLALRRRRLRLGQRRARHGRHALVRVPALGRPRHVPPCSGDDAARQRGRRPPQRALRRAGFAAQRHALGRRREGGAGKRVVHQAVLLLPDRGRVAKRPYAQLAAGRPDAAEYRPAARGAAVADFCAGLRADRAGLVRARQQLADRVGTRRRDEMARPDRHRDARHRRAASRAVHRRGRRRRRLRPGDRAHRQLQQGRFHRRLQPRDGLPRRADPVGVPRSGGRPGVSADAAGLLPLRPGAVGGEDRPLRPRLQPAGVRDDLLADDSLGRRAAQRCDDPAARLGGVPERSGRAAVAGCGAGRGQCGRRAGRRGPVARLRHERRGAAWPRDHLPARHRPGGGAMRLALAAAAAVAEPLPGLAGCTPELVCSFNVPPGDYELQVALGSSTEAADTGVQVEARRVALAPVATAPGQIVVRSATVDVRTPESMPDGQEGDGTPGLQVYLTGDAPALAGIHVVPLQHIPRLFVVSDSTAADWLFGPKRGWAQALPQDFRAGISVANWAVSRSSTVSWLADPALFATLAPLIRPDDEVLIQLAHNDKTTTEADYRANLTALVDGVRARGGLAVLVTPPVRHLFAADGTITPTGRVVTNLGVDLPAVMRDVAAELGAPLLDLTADSQALMERLGPTDSWQLYVGTQAVPTDATHFNPYGSAVIAGLVADEIAAAHLPAAGFLR